MVDTNKEVQLALVSCAQGVEPSLQRLYQLEAPRMMSLALHMVGQRAIAEDLLTDTFVLIWKNADSYEPGRGSARAWLYSILRYRALGRLRQAGRPAGSQTGFASFPSAESLRVAANSSPQGRFLAGVAVLDDTVRLAVFMAFFKGYDYPRIAQRLERSVSQARQMVTQGLLSLLDDPDDTEASYDPERSVRLAEYTLGLLGPDEVKGVHALLANDDAAVLEALGWEERFLGLADLLAVVHPSGQVYYRIQARLGHDAIPAPATLLRQPEHAQSVVPPAQSVGRPEFIVPIAAAEPETPPPTPSGIEHQQAPEPENVLASSARTQAAGLLSQMPHSPPEPVEQGGPVSSDVPEDRTDIDRAPTRIVRVGQGWKLATLVFALTTAAALATHAVRPPPEPPVTVIKIAPQMGAIMQPPASSSTPGWVVSMDHQQNLVFRPLVHTEIPGDAVVRLWTQATPTERPRLLATIDPNQAFTLPAAQTGLIKEGQILEMTQESAVDNKSSESQGPVLYLGRMVSFGVQAPTEPVSGPAS